MDILTILAIFGGGLAGGFVTGLSGFGTGLVGMPFWLAAVNPVVAAQISALGGVTGQLQTLSAVRPALSWSHIGPIIVAGLFGVPVGVYLLPSVPEDWFRSGVGGLLVAFSLFLLLVPHSWRFAKRHRAAEVVFGFIGGFMGGLMGLPGPPATMWGTLQNWSRIEKRAVYQTFNIAVLLFMLTVSLAAGQMTMAFVYAGLAAVPGIVIGSFIGVRTYHLLDDRGFDRIVLAVLMLTGVALLFTS